MSILGIPDIYSQSLCIIEWPERLGLQLPKNYIDIGIEIDPKDLTTRNLKVSLIFEEDHSRKETLRKYLSDF